MAYVIDKPYEYFICYYQRAAEDFAQIMYDTLTKDLGKTVYVDHVYRNLMSGNFEDNIDNIIHKCKVFILLNTTNALSRYQVIREVKIAFPEGVQDNHEFWIFKEESVDVEFITPEFMNETKLDLSKYH